MRPLTLPTRTFHNRRRVVVPMPTNSEPLAALREVFLRCRDMDAGLGERLEAYSRAVRTLIPDYAAAVDQLVSRLSTAARGGAGAGRADARVRLARREGRLTSLESLLRNGPVAITFHRGHWCPWCRISGRALAQVHHDIVAEVARSWRSCPSGRSSPRNSRRAHQYPFPVLTDLDNGYAMSLNLAIWVGPDLERLLSSFGHSLPDYQGNEAWMLPIPATFVVGTDGRVAARFIDPDFRRRMSIEELLAALKAARAESAPNAGKKNPGTPCRWLTNRAATRRRHSLLRQEHSPRRHRRGQVGWRDQNAELLAPDDHALIVLQIDAGRDRIALAALECAQAAEVDEHHVFDVGGRADRRLGHQIDVKRRSRADLEIGFEIDRALVDADVALAIVHRVGRVGMDERAGGDQLVRSVAESCSEAAGGGKT